MTGIYAEYFSKLYTQTYEFISIRNENNQAKHFKPLRAFWYLLQIVLKESCYPTNKSYYSSIMITHIGRSI